MVDHPHFGEVRDADLRRLAQRIRATEPWRPRPDWLQQSKARLMAAFDVRTAGADKRS